MLRHKTAELPKTISGNQLKNNENQENQVNWSIESCFHICRDCNSCMRDLYCGFCYMDEPKGPVNGSCLQSDYNNPLAATEGRCNHTDLKGIQLYSAVVFSTGEVALQG